MQQKQISRVMEFIPDSDTQKILEGISQNARDKYINDAIKAFSSAAATSLNTKNVSARNSPADRVNAELNRIFGADFVGIVASKGDSDDYVAITETDTQLRARCGTSDILDILKSLRQPITAQEVWDIISVLG